MPDLTELQAFEDHALDELQAVINDYYDYVEASDTPARRGIARTRASAALQRTLRTLHIEASLIGSDGQMSGEDRAQLREIVSADSDYMAGFVDDLATWTRGQSLNRCNAYVSTLRKTTTTFQTINLPPLPIVPQSEDLICGRHCKCHLRTVKRDGNGNYDVYWVVDATAEHCDDCLRLAAEWQPLEIRAGEIQKAARLSDKDLRRIKALLAIARAA